MTTWTVRAAVLAIAGLLALTGCGGDPEAAPQDPPTVTVTETATQSAGTPSEPTDTTDAAEPEPTAAVALTEPPRTYDEAIAHFAAAFAVEDIPQELSRFETPSGNIYCVLDDDAIPPSCEIGLGGVRDPAICGDGPSPTVGRIEFADDGGVVPLCNSDTIRTPGPPILGYGAVAAWAGVPVQCLAEEIGVTCVNTATEQGFFLARGRYQLL